MSNAASVVFSVTAIVVGAGSVYWYSISTIGSRQSKQELLHRLRSEGRTRTLSAPSPDLDPAKDFLPSARPWLDLGLLFDHPRPGVLPPDVAGAVSTAPPLAVIIECPINSFSILFVASRISRSFLPSVRAWRTPRTATSTMLTTISPTPSSRKNSCHQPRKTSPDRRSEVIPLRIKSSVRPASRMGSRATFRTDRASCSPDSASARPLADSNAVIIRVIGSMV